MAELASTSSPATDAGAEARVSRAAWYALTLLTAASFLNYLDRMVLAALLEPIKVELRLADSQLGLLSGLAFAIFYATMGIPLARVADRATRVRLLAASLALWSVMTVASGLARNFLQLFLARMGVGVGESACIPTAHSLIGDYMPPARRALGISIFQAGGLAGMSFGLIGIGLIAEQVGWRAALMIVGAVGIPLVLLMIATLPEPKRRGAPAPVGGESAKTAIGALLRRPALRHLIAAQSIGAFGTIGAQQWIPTFFVRVHDLSLAQMGVWVGVVSGMGGVGGVLLGGVMATRLVPKDSRWELWLPALTYVLAAPAFLVAFVAPHAPTAFGATFIASFLVATGGGVAISAVQSFAEPHRRATAISLLVLLSSLIGLGLGPWLVGVASDALADTKGQQSLRYGLLLSPICLLWASLHFGLAARRSRQDRVD